MAWIHKKVSSPFALTRSQFIRIVWCARWQFHLQPVQLNFLYSEILSDLCVRNHRKHLEHHHIDEEGNVKDSYQFDIKMWVRRECLRADSVNFSCVLLKGWRWLTCSWWLNIFHSHATCTWSWKVIKFFFVALQFISWIRNETLIAFAHISTLITRWQRVTRCQAYFRCKNNCSFSYTNVTMRTTACSEHKMNF